MNTKVLASLAILFAHVSASGGRTDKDDSTIRLKAAVELKNKGNYEAAERSLRAAVEQAETLGSTDPRAAVLFNDLGSVYHFENKYAQAEWAYRRAIDLCQAACGPEAPLTARFTVNLAQLYLETGQYAKAERLGIRSLVIRFKEFPDDLVYFRLVGTLGDLASVQGRYAEAESAFDEALALWEKHQPGGKECMRVLNNLGVLYYVTGRNAGALSYFERALQIAEKAPQPGDLLRVKAWLNVAFLRLIEHGPVDAEPSFQKALDIGEKELGPNHPLIGQVLDAYAKALKQMNHKKEAKAFEQRSRAILRSTSGLRGPKYTVDVIDLRQGK